MCLPRENVGTAELSYRSSHKEQMRFSGSAHPKCICYHRSLHLLNEDFGTPCPSAKHIAGAQGTLLETNLSPCQSCRLAVGIRAMTHRASPSFPVLSQLYFK